MNQCISTCQGNFIPCKYFLPDLENVFLFELVHPVGNPCLPLDMMENTPFDGPNKTGQVNQSQISKENSFLAYSRSLDQPKLARVYFQS